MTLTGAATTRDVRTDIGGPADVLVVFGITGDLARVMTFRSLYRLERRGLVAVPVVGAAVDDWTVEELVEHARSGRQARHLWQAYGLRDRRDQRVLSGAAVLEAGEEHRLSRRVYLGRHASHHPAALGAGSAAPGPRARSSCAG